MFICWVALTCFSQVIALQLIPFFIRLSLFTAKGFIRRQVYEVDSVQHVMREVGTKENSLHLGHERSYLWYLASHSSEQVGNTIRDLSEHGSGFMLHGDQVGSTLVCLGEQVVVGNKLMDLFLLVRKALLHESTFGLG